MRMIVPDEQAVQSLCASGARHRTTVTWWLLKSYRWVDVTPGFNHAKPDRNALAIEIFWHYMAQLEALEMTYFALRDKARNRRRSLFETYVGIKVVEHFQRRQPSEKSYSGRRILIELRNITPSKFAERLGLPQHGGMTGACCGAAPPAGRISEREYNQYMRQEISWMRRALRNKNRRYLHQAYVRFKHGFAVLGHPESESVFAVNRTRRRTHDSCIAEVVRLNTSEDFVLAIAQDVSLIGSLIIRLWGMYLARSPCEACERCSCKNEDRSNWMEESTKRGPTPPSGAPEG